MAKPNILQRSRKKKALASFQAGRYEEALHLYQGICKMDPLDADARMMCATAAGLRGDHTLAESYCRQALAIDPKLASAHYNLGIALRAQGRLLEACGAFQRATEFRTHYAEALEATAHAHVMLSDWVAAAKVLNTIISIWPDKADMHCALGTAYQAMGHTSDAIAAYETALKFNPRLQIALNSLGSAYLKQADIERAERCFRQCLEMNPADLRARSNLLMLQNYLPGADPDRMLSEHLEWGKVAKSHIPRMTPSVVTVISGRRLRVGYLSSDFREHSVASFIEPVLQHHDRSRFEVCCYSNLPTPDATTQRIRTSVDLWRDIDKLSDSEAASLIREDHIDILVDLAGHTGNNRLGILAAKPAPLQITWIGYPNTTGLDTVDYRVTDGIADPTGEDTWFSEKLLRLDGCFLCYQPPVDAPEVAPLPAQANGHITFGSFNNYSKLNPSVLLLWAEILKQVPGSRLLLKCLALSDSKVRERIQTDMHALGIGSERLELLGHALTRHEHLALYAKVDIALDTFPYNGTTTTCEALWMGVPVLSLVGKHHAGRVGASLLTAAGLTNWLANTPESFVATARARAADIAGLVHLRKLLRNQLAESLLCDAAGFALRFEEAMRQAWDRKVQEIQLSK